MQNSINIQLVAEPLEFSMSQRASFRIGFKAKNVGSQAIDPNLYAASLLVEGKPNLAWNLAIQNGPRDEAWRNLEPGETVSASWPLGEAMFPDPGEYEIVLRSGAQESPVHVRVVP